MFKIVNGIPIWGEHDEATIAQINRCASDEQVAAAALMCDGHKGYSMPIGGVVAYRGAVSPSGVGYDISCGNKAVRTNIHAEELKPRIKQVMDQIARTVVFGVGQTSGKARDHDLFDDPTWRDLPQVGKLRQLAREQLGTVGSGNHFVDLFEDEDGWVWIGVHFGSRGLGHRTASGFLNLAAGRAFDDKAPGEHMDQPATVLSLKTDLGQAYWQAMTLAGRYAYAGRDFVVSQVLEILGAHATDEVHNHHNYCVAGDAIVPTAEGPRQMKDIKVGDTIFAVDIELGPIVTQVMAHWRSGTKPIYKIRTRGRSIRVSAKHPLLTIDVDQEPHPDRPWFKKHVGVLRWKQAREINPGDIVVCAEGYYGGSTQLRPGLARFVGAYLGDGWVRADTRRQGYTVGVAIGALGEQHTTRYHELCTALWSGVMWKSNMPGAFGLTCSSRDVYRELEALEITFTSREKYVPSWVYQLSFAERLDLLAGYIDSDGNVPNSNTSNQGRAKVASVNQRLVQGLRELAISCGLQVSNVISRVATSNFGAAAVYSFGIGASDTALLPLWHQEKQTNQRETSRDTSRLQQRKIGYMDLPPGLFALSVLSIDIEAEEAVYDLEIAHESHSFICEGIVVHNCWKETHNGQDLCVVRKGATPAWPGQRGFIGGSMGDISVIVEGVASDEATSALHSTVHGAGRVMSRTQAAGKRRWVKRDGRRVQEIVKPGKISREMMTEWLKREGVELRGAGADESPHVYRRLPEVLAAHAGSIRVLHTLRPLGVAMAGEDVFDEYKD